MRDEALVKVADLLLEAHGLVRGDHPPVLRLALDVTLFEVGRCIAGGNGDGGVENGYGPHPHEANRSTGANRC